MNSCSNCGKAVNSQTDCFVISYLPPDFGSKKNTSRTVETLYFHPDCFVSVAGQEFAEKLAWRKQSDYAALKDYDYNKHMRQAQDTQRKGFKDMWMKEFYDAFGDGKK